MSDELGITHTVMIEAVIKGLQDKLPQMRAELIAQAGGIQ